MSSTGQVEQWGRLPVQICLPNGTRKRFKIGVRLLFLESTRTTKLYDRRVDEVTLDEVERIAI